MTRASEPWGGREWSGDSNFLRQAGVGTSGFVQAKPCSAHCLSLVEFSFDIACSIETGTSSGARSLRL